MGDLAVDTAVEAVGDGRFRATVSPDWEIWGPNGGYLSGLALRAAAAVSAQPRPAALSCHFLSVARFAPVELEVISLRAARRAESLRVVMRQDGVAVLEALLWMTGPADGLAHDAAPAPEVEPPDQVPTVQERLGPDAAWPPFRFWDNFEWRPLEWTGPFPEREPGEPVTRNWYRFTPRATFDDPVVDAIRSLILLDTMSWPAARRAHPPGDLGYIAPSLDVNVQFHRSEPSAEWLLLEGRAPVAEDGLIAFSSKVWSATGRLLGSGAGQMMCRPTR